MNAAIDQDKVTCHICGKAKSLKSFTLLSQVRSKICNGCKDKKYFSGSYASFGAPKYDFKIVKCLKCGKAFKGGKKLRICPKCKGSKSYIEAANGLNFL